MKVISDMSNCLTKVRCSVQGKTALGNNSGTRHLEVYVCFYLDQGGYQM